MKISLLFFAFGLLLSLSLVSCNKEQEVIDDLSAFAQKLEKESGNYSIIEWQDALAEYEKIHASGKECRLTHEPQIELRRLDAKIATLSLKAGPSMMKEVIQGTTDVMKAYIDGIEELESAFE